MRTSKVKPNVSIIVPVYNGEGTLPLCLDSLMNQDYPKEDLEIIVVDNASTDETAKIIKQYPVRYVFEPHKNRVRARNFGIKLAQGKFVAFLDADCIAHKNWIKNLLEGCNNSSVGGCGGEIYTFHPSTLWEKYAENRGFFRQEVLIGKEKLLPNIKTANAIYLRDVLENIGLFDETFHCAEDKDLSLRIALKGLKLVYVSDAIVFHKHRNSLGGFWSQFFEYGRDDKIISEKYKNIIALRSGYTFKNVFRLKKHFKKLNIQEKLLEILFLVIDAIKYLAYLAGWLSFYLFRQPSIKPYKEQSSVPDKVFRKLDGELIISNISKNYNYALGKVGTLIYELLTAGATEKEVINKLSEKYQVDRVRLEGDFTEFISELKKEKIL